LMIIIIPLSPVRFIQALVSLFEPMKKSKARTLNGCVERLSSYDKINFEVRDCLSKGYIDFLKDNKVRLASDVKFYSNSVVGNYENLSCDVQKKIHTYIKIALQKLESEHDQPLENTGSCRMLADMIIEYMSLSNAVPYYDTLDTLLLWTLNAMKQGTFIRKGNKKSETSTSRNR